MALIPLARARDYLTMLRDEFGLPISECEIDIGSDNIKVVPPSGEEATTGVEKYVNREPSAEAIHPFTTIASEAVGGGGGGAVQAVPTRSQKVFAER